MKTVQNNLTVVPLTASGLTKEILHQRPPSQDKFLKNKEKSYNPPKSAQNNENESPIKKRLNARKEAAKNYQLELENMKEKSLNEQNIKKIDNFVDCGSKNCEKIKNEHENLNELIKPDQLLLTSNFHRKITKNRNIVGRKR